MNEGANPVLIIEKGLDVRAENLHPMGRVVFGRSPELEALNGTTKLDR